MHSIAIGGPGTGLKSDHFGIETEYYALTRKLFLSTKIRPFWD